MPFILSLLMMRKQSFLPFQPIFILKTNNIKTTKRYSYQLAFSIKMCIFVLTTIFITHKL